MTPYIDRAKYDAWETPLWFFDLLNEEFEFDLDACAMAGTAKCRTFFSKVENAFLMPWPKSVFCNPPWGKGLREWIQKARIESRTGTRTVMLVPARTDAAWFHDLMEYSVEVRFIRGRIEYVGPGSRVPVGTIVAVLGPTGGPARIQIWNPKKGQPVPLETLGQGLPGERFGR